MLDTAKASLNPIDPNPVVYLQRYSGHIRIWHYWGLGIDLQL